ncbi:MAG TPA: serine/threonine-protein kinase [Chthoniobacterales bacterium]|nr:serine/threonine-protein kinase [Chthoniobacterales bacterium]
MSQLQTAGTTQTCPKCSAKIDTADAEPLARVPCPICGEIIRVERTFDHFALVETLGIGGMATVYKARDTFLDRFVALKVVRRDLGTGVDRTLQLQQEARAAAAINHPNVVQVFSSGTDRGQFYLVTELLEHGSLDDLIERRKRVSEQRLLETGIQIASGLRAAQAKGLIHRDIKPANILFADEYTAKIGDFGLAGVAAQTAETRGEIWGTPYYVAPERLDRQVEDFRSDIYSLGATLYHAVAGRAPIEADTTSASELRKLKQQPLDLRRIAPDVSAPTAQVLQRMLAPVPAERFASYDQLIQELERALKTTTEQRKIDAPPVNRKSRPIAAIAAVVLVVGFGVLVFAWNLERSITSKKARTPDNTRVQSSATPRTAAGATAQSSRGVSWEAALAGYKRHVALYDFAGARASIQAAQVSGRSAIKSQEAMASIAQWLVEWKDKLIVDLNKKQFHSALTDINGVQYTGITGGNAEQLMLKTRYGIIGARWPTLSPNILLAVSASFISPRARDAADRQWLCAAFASQTGQSEEARRFAEAAAKAKSGYRRQIGLLLSPASTSR